MIKTVKINDKDVRMSTAFSWMLKYSEQFHEDPAKVIIPAMLSSQGEDAVGGFLASIGFIGTIRIAWSCAAIVDDSIGTPEQWLESFGEEFPVMSVAMQIMPEIFRSMNSKKKAQMSE